MNRGRARPRGDDPYRAPSPTSVSTARGNRLSSPCFPITWWRSTLLGRLSECRPLRATDSGQKLRHIETEQRAHLRVERAQGKAVARRPELVNERLREVSECRGCSAATAPPLPDAKRVSQRKPGGEGSDAPDERLSPEPFAPVENAAYRRFHRLVLTLDCFAISPTVCEMDSRAASTRCCSSSFDASCPGG